MPSHQSDMFAAQTNNPMYSTITPSSTSSSGHRICPAATQNQSHIDPHHKNPNTKHRLNSDFTTYASVCSDQISCVKPLNAVVNAANGIITTNFVSEQTLYHGVHVDGKFLKVDISDFVKAIKYSISTKTRYLIRAYSEKKFE